MSYFMWMWSKRAAHMLTLLKVVKDKTVTPPLHRGASQNREFQKIKTNGRIDRLLRHNIMTAYNIAD